MEYQFNDPYETSIDPSFFDITNPTLADLSITDNNAPHQNHHGVFQQSHDTNFNHHFSNHNGILQQEHGTNDFEMSQNDSFDYNAMSSHPMHEDQQTQPLNQIPVSMNQTDAMTLDQWPPTPIPYFCSCCQVLREIIHANGSQFEKLEIHGRLGLITHAIHHQTPVNGDLPISQMIDLSRKSLDEIKNYLAQYCMEHILEGYFILQDPMSAYYETLCTGLDWIEDFNMEGPVDNNQNNSDEMVEQEQEQQQVSENGNPITDKKNLSEQREKAGKLTLNDLCDYFHLPIEEAAKTVDLCPTVLKKTCRKAGLARWPHRKVKSLLKQIALLGTQLEKQEPATRARTEEDISRLKQEMIDHCGGHIPTAMYNIAAFLPPKYQKRQ
ncbi:uncharacterized protein LOC131655152 [Vicia villosa]|uniref:uncharacterized protein LOC131655152 n=1 Tax=Vicia villosa TaxID=3911 RepID=UPI00273CDBC8|nr:uncharacterized protein LOC131655152 [Vicia villosa]